MDFETTAKNKKLKLAVRIETLVRKAYSLNTHDYKNTKMTEILMMILTPQLQTIAIKKRGSHPFSIREPDLDFRKLVDKLEQCKNHFETRRNRKPKATICKQHPNDYFTDKKYQGL